MSIILPLTNQKKKNKIDLRQVITDSWYHDVNVGSGLSETILIQAANSSASQRRPRYTCMRAALNSHILT